MDFYAKQRADEMRNFLDGVVGVVEASSYERHMLWIEYSETALKHGCAISNKSRRFTWESGRSGLMEIVGKIDDRPVCVTLWVDTIDDQKILFVDPTSQVVDHQMIEKWLKGTLPATAIREDGYINRSDPMNFCNVFPRPKVVELMQEAIDAPQIA